jgi:hypothetical protein
LPNARLEAACFARLPKSWPVSGASMPQSRMRCYVLYAVSTVIVSPSAMPMTRAE